MKNLIVRCTVCGLKHENQNESQLITCKACGNSFLKNDGIILSQKPDEDVESLKKLRIRLDEMIRVNDFKMILIHSQDILKILPDDGLATYFFAYSQYQLHQPKFLYEFIYKFEVNMTLSHLKIVLGHMVSYVDIKEYDIILNFVKKSDISYYDEAKKIIDERIELEEMYSVVQRDFFICHRSTDLNIVLEIVKELEGDGYTCWYSNRNLRKDDHENYNKNIDVAIEHSHVFLVITSRSAMLSKDVQREVQYANKLNKLKLEYKIDESSHTTLFKQSFDGIKWIDASKESQYETLRSRAFQVLSDHIDTMSQSSKIKATQFGQSTIKKESNTYQSKDNNRILNSIETKKLKQTPKLEVSINKLESKKLLTSDYNDTEIQPNEETALKSSALFMENNLHDIAKSHLMNVYSKDSNNIDLIFALILTELKISYKIFELDFTQLKMSYSKNLDIYLNHLLLLLNDSEEHKTILDNLMLLLRYLMINLKESNDNIHSYLSLYRFMIHLNTIDFLNDMIQEFIFEAEKNNIILDIDLANDIYESFRDVILNHDVNLLGKFIIDFLLKRLDKNIFVVHTIVQDALFYLPQNTELNRLKLISFYNTNTFNEAIISIITTQKYKMLDEHLSIIDMPEIEIINILKQIRNDDLFVKKIPIKKIFSFVNYLLQYIPNFSVNLYAEQLNKMGYFYLKHGEFKESSRLFNLCFKINKSEHALWGLVLAGVKCHDEFELFRKKIELIDIKDYNNLLNISPNIDFYNQIYLSIKKNTLSSELKQEIVKKWHILEN